MAGDRIEINGLRVLGVHGVLPEERERAQPFEVDIVLEVDLSTAGSSDALTDTVDYGEVVAAAASVVSGESYELLERLAQRIADEALTDSRVDAVEVRVAKLRPPLPNDLSDVAVRIRRTQTG